MCKKKWDIWDKTTLVGIIGLAIYACTYLVSSNSCIIIIRLLSTVVATISFITRMGYEIATKQRYIQSIIMILISLCDVAVSIFQIMKHSF